MVNDEVVNYAGAGKRIKTARIKQDLSQDSLATKASLVTFVKIANALGLSLNDPF